MVLKSFSKDLFVFYRDVVETHVRLQKIGRAYKSNKHINHYIHNMQFYHDLANSNNFAALFHLPKILKDRMQLKNNTRRLHENVNHLHFYKSMHGIGVKMTDWQTHKYVGY